ncbi:MAG: hypothetical protein ACYC27_01055 [Armatimonadota bacterium]
MKPSTSIAYVVVILAAGWFAYLYIDSRKELVVSANAHTSDGYLLQTECFLESGNGNEGSYRAVIKVVNNIKLVTSTIATATVGSSESTMIRSNPVSVNIETTAKDTTLNIKLNKAGYKIMPVTEMDSPLCYQSIKDGAIISLGDIKPATDRSIYVHIIR